MRGRTNITPRKEPIINGNIVQATVEANNSISVGDFVEYRIDYAEASETNYNITILDELNTTNYKVLLVSRNNQAQLELWKKSTQEKVNTIVVNENGTIAIMCLVDSSHLLVFANNIYYYIEFSSDEFTVIQSTLYSASPNPTALCVLDSSHFGAFVKQSGSSNYDMKVYIFSFNSTAVTYQTYKTFSLGYGYKTYASYVKKVASDRIMLFGTNSNSNYDQNVHLVSFDGSYNFTNLSNISFESAVYQVDVNDNLFAFLNYTEPQSTSSNDIFKLHLVKYNSTGDAIDNYLTLDLSTVFGTFPFRRGSVSISLLNENQLAIFGCLNTSLSTSNREGTILTYNASQGEYSIADKITIASSLKYSDAKFVVASSANVKLLTDISLVRLKIQDNEFEHLSDANYVKSYTGGKSIGFAKTAGNAGDVIRIYTPT